MIVIVLFVDACFQNQKEKKILLLDQKLIYTTHTNMHTQNQREKNLPLDQKLSLTHTNIGGNLNLKKIILQHFALRYGNHSTVYTYAWSLHI